MIPTAQICLFVYQLLQIKHQAVSKNGALFYMQKTFIPTASNVPTMSSVRVYCHVSYLIPYIQSTDPLFRINVL